MPFVQYQRLSETAELIPLVPNVSFIMRRYIIPPSHADSHEALLIKPRQPLKVGAYITHTGSDSFMDFVDTLERAFDPDDAIFVSTFARARGAAAAQKQDLESFSQHPCAQALQHAEKLVVVVDKGLSFTQCLWCNYEIKWAREWRTASFVWPHTDVELVELQNTISNIDLTDLVSSNPEDEYNFRIAIDGNNLDLQAVSQQLREFLQDRLVSYAAAFQRATDFSEISTEKVRRLHVEHERRTAIKEFEWEHKELKSATSQRIDELEKELASLQAERKAEQQAHALLKEKMKESDANHVGKNTQLESEMRHTVGDLQKDIRRLHDMLKEAHAKTAQAQEQQDELRQRELDMRRKLEDLSNRAEAAELRAETEGQRADQEHYEFVEQQKLYRSNLEEVDEAHKQKNSALQAQKKAEQALKLLEEKVLRLEEEAQMETMAHEAAVQEDEGVANSRTAVAIEPSEQPALRRSLREENKSTRNSTRLSFRQGADPLALLEAPSCDRTSMATHTASSMSNLAGKAKSYFDWGKSSRGDDNSSKS